MFSPSPTDAQLAVLQRVEREAARAFVAQCDALQELWDTAPADTRQGRRPHVLAEAGAALHLHPLSVGSRLAVADLLRAHPLLRGLLLDGGLGVAHVFVIDAEMGPLGDADLAGRVLRDVLASQGRLGWDGTPSELRRALARAAVRLDPQAAARRREEQTAARTGVRLRPAGDGLATWVTTGPGVALTTADRLLDELSRPDGPDDDRTRGQRQLDALLGALSARVGGGVPLELQLGIPVRVTATRPVRGCAPEPAAIAADLTPELLALLAGAAPEAAPRVPAQRVDPDEAPAPDNVTATPAAGPRSARRDGVAELVDLGPVDPRLLAELLTDPAGLPAGISEIRVRRTCTDRTGQVVAIDDRPTPLAKLLAPPGTTAADLLTRLLHGLPAPPPTTDTHDPTAAQTRLVRARDRSCTFPGCGQRARRCELDHRQPHPHGPTSTTNLQPLCAHHHHLKHDGWHSQRDPDGTTHWTSPRGQHLTVRPS